MKQFVMMLVCSLMLMFGSVASADFVVVENSNGGVVVSWTKPSGASYYEVGYLDKTDDNAPGLSGYETFQETVTLSGLFAHHIYEINVRAYASDGSYVENLGNEYFVPGLSNTDTCNVTCPEIPEMVCPNVNPVKYGTVAEDWWSGLALCNSTTETQVLTLLTGNVTNYFNISSGSCETVLLKDLIETEGKYPISLVDPVEGTSVSVLLGNMEGGIAGQ